MSAEPAPAVSPPGGEVPRPPSADPSPAHAPDPAARPGALTPREHEVLAFERQWWRRPGAKETAIRDRFGLAPIRYYQVLNALVDRPAALEADPLLVRRLRRLRAARGQRRTAQILGNGGRGI
ncbi:Protein of unknown function [Geodermatophilus pulveris]|uniref:DUF3263 domain-containing protein n=1 Tax=Geodermatophilus pulveris TaxID=1564159 RepID=A0A239H6T9_9ACTN|nr:DUF3263 domain-containing protein [Geodermatophilus pulveris]SNS77146.1 Protein of unknown function [Geodermatophilus pulveris]